MVLKSQNTIAAKVTIPAISLCFCTWVLIRAFSLGTFLFSLLALLPLVAIALWLVWIPYQIEVVANDKAISIVRWGSSIYVSVAEVESVSPLISVFYTLRLKSGKKIVYIDDPISRGLRERLH